MVSFSSFASIFCSLSLIYLIFCRNSAIKNDKDLISSSNSCWPLDFGHGSVVCQCNATYCDTVPIIRRENLNRGFYFQVYSNKNGSRFVMSQERMTKRVSLNPRTSAVKIQVDRNVHFQNVEGFGGAFTDATGLNIASLSKPLQDTIIRQYFDEQEGLNYTFARVPMAGTDFSIRTYSYDDYYDGDVSLSHFRLQTEDITYKIPYIQQAMRLQPSLKLIASPWSAPAWMKTNKAFTGKGSLQTQYYQTWANYFLKFLEGYSTHNISFWGVTAQNEPNSGNLVDYPFNCMGWTAEEQRDWIKGYLGPTLKNSSFSPVHIIMLDDDRISLALWSNVILSDVEAAKYVSGIGLHWYLDSWVSADILTKTHNNYPDKWLLATEASAGAFHLEQPVILGSWERAESYAEDIISDLNHWIIGWVDWNLALNVSGGPSWADNEVDSPIIVDYQQDVIYKQPMFYALGHFSKFIPSGSVRILNESDDLQGLSVLTCLRPDGLVTVVVLNAKTEGISIQINDTSSGIFNVEISANSIYTIVYV